MRPRHFAKLTVSLLPLLAAAGCAVGPDYETPKVETPDAWRDQSAPPTAGELATRRGLCPAHAAEEDDASIASLAWWEVFTDPQLQALITTALENNKDIRAAVARLEAARAAAGIANSVYYPSIGYSATAFRSDPKTATTLPNMHGFTVGGTVNWELDLWGRVRRLNEAAFARFAATADAKNAVVLSIVSAIASSYFNLQALDAKYEIARHTVELRGKALWLTNEKLDKDVGNKIDPLQYEAEMLAARADMRAFKEAIARQENAISALLGQTPAPVARTTVKEFKPLFNAAPAGIPSDLLLRRPDLRAAAQNVRAVNAQIGANIANYFPKITLTGILGFASPQLKELFDGHHKAAQGGGSILGPLFDAASTYYSVKEARALTLEAVANYEKTAFAAFAEVNDALTSLQISAERLDDLAAIVDRRAQVLEKLQLAREVGTLSLFPVIDADRYLYASKLALVDSQFANHTAAIQLYKALGGGWRSADLKKPLVNHKGQITDGPGKNSEEGAVSPGDKVPDTK